MNSVILRSRIVFSVLLLLIVASNSLAFKSTADAAANRSWPGFWRQFTSAVNKKDHEGLIKVMPADFFDGGGGMTPVEWLRFMDENVRNGSWKDLQRSVARGTVVNKQWSRKGVLTRFTRDNGYYFEFRKDKKWYFAGVVGD